MLWYIIGNDTLCLTMITNNKDVLFFCVNLRKDLKIYSKDKNEKDYFHTDYGFYYGVRNDML